jgi:hypothetical protein
MRTMEILGNFTMEELVRYSTLSYSIAIVRQSTLSYSIAIVRQSTRTTAQNPGTVRLWLLTAIALPTSYDSIWMGETPPQPAL